MSTIVSDFNVVIHVPARLRIMATLAACPPEMMVQFSRLRDLVGLTDGNLGAHIATLESVGYVAVTKDFHHKRPRTRVKATARGRTAYLKHVTALRAILDTSAPATDGG